MAVCAACRAAAPAAQVGPSQAGAVLVLRVWAEENGLRARLLTSSGVRETVVVAHGTDAICDAVRRWLTGL